MKFPRRLSCVLLVVLMNLNVQGQGEYPELLPHQATGFAWSSQGDRYVTGHVNGDVRIYDAGVAVRVIPSAHTDAIFTLALSPDGSRLVTGGMDGHVRIWNTNTCALLEEFLYVGEVVTAIDWSPDGNFIFVTPFSGDNFIISADIAADSYVISQTTKVRGSDGVAWNPESTTVAVGGYLLDLFILEFTSVPTRELDFTPNFDPWNAPTEFTTSVEWHPTANIVANGNINGWVLIWDLDAPSDAIPFHSLQGNNGVTDHATIPFYHRVVDIRFSDDGHTISSVSMDGTLRTWDVGTGEMLSDTNLGEQVLAGAFSPDGSQLVYSTYSAADIPPTVIDLPLTDTDSRSPKNK